MKALCKTGGIAAIVMMAQPAQLVAQTADPHFDITASLYGRHNSNIVRTSKSAAEARGISRADQTLSPTLTLDMLRPVGQHQINLQASAGYQFYRKNTRLNRESLSADGLASLHLGSCDAEIGLAYSRRQSDLGETAILADSDTRSLVNVENVTRARSSLTCGKPYGIRPMVNVGYERARNSASLRSQTNRDAFDYGGGLVYTHPSIGDIQAFISRRETRFVDQPVALENGRDGYDLTNYGVRYSRDIGSKLKGSVQLGYSDISTRNNRGGGGGGMNWSADLAMQATDRLLLHAQVSRDINSTLAVDSLYQRNTIYLFDASYAVNERMNVQAGVMVKPRRFYGVLPTLAPRLEHDRQTQVFGSVNYKMSPRLNLSLDGGWEKRTANSDIFNYTNTYAGLRVGLTL